MPKKKVQAEKWPFRIRGLYIIVAVSLLLNAIALSFIGFLNSKYADYALINHSLNRICERDYDYFMEDARKNSEQGAAILSEGLCQKDSSSGRSLFDIGRANIVNGHLEIKPPTQ